MAALTTYQTSAALDALNGNRGLLDALFRGTSFQGENPEEQHMRQMMAMNGYAFGSPNNTQYSSKNDVWHSTYDLTEAYIGKPVFLGTVITGLAYYDNNEFILQEPDGLPMVMTNEQHWEWNEILFDIPYVDVVPHEGPYRHVRARKLPGRAGTQRRGLGIDIEHDWFQHEMGRVQFMRHVQQVKNGWLYTMTIGAYRALEVARPAHVKYLRESGTLQQYDLHELYMEKARLAFPFMRSHQGARREINAVQDALAARGGRLSAIHMDTPACGKFFQGVGVKNQEYQYAGDRANNWFYQNPSEVKSIPGDSDIRLRIASFNESLGMYAPLREHRVTGEYYTMFGLPTERLDVTKYRTHHRNIRIYNYDSDSFEVITLRDCLDNSGLFDDNGKLVDGMYTSVDGNDVGDLFSNRLLGDGSTAKKFKDLSDAIFPPHLLKAMVKSIKHKANAEGMNVAELMGALTASGSRPKTVLGSSHERFFIKGKLGADIPNDAHFYGALVERPEEQQTTPDASASAPANELNRDFSKRLTSEQAEIYNQILGSIKSNAVNSKFVTAMSNHPSDGTVENVSIGATLSNIASVITSSATSSSTARASNALLTAIEQIPQAKAVPVASTTVSSVPVEEREVYSVGVYPASYIASCGHDFCPMSVETNEPAELDESYVQKDSFNHHYLHAAGGIGFNMQEKEEASKYGKTAEKAFERRLRGYDGTERGLAASILALPIKYQTFCFFLDNDIVFPVGFIIPRQYMSMMTATALMGSFGRNTGFSPMSDIDLMWGDDPDVKRHSLNFSGYVTSIVVNPETYLVRDDLFITRMTGGFTTKWFSSETIKVLKESLWRQVVVGNKQRPSIYPLVTPYRMKMREVIDVRGRFTECSGVTKARPDGEIFFQSHIPKDISILMGARRMATADPYGAQTGYNSICYVGTHYVYNPETDRLDGVVCGKGWLGANIYSGCRAALDSCDLLEEQNYHNRELSL